MIGNVEIDRSAPQNIEMEKAILSAIMLDNRAFNDVVDFLKVESFYLPAHQKIYEAILELDKKGSPIDLPILATTLNTLNSFEVSGGVQYLIELSNYIASSANAQYHAQIVAQKYMQRSLISLGNELINKAYSNDSDVFQTIEQAESKLRDLFYGATSDPIKGSVILNQAIEKIKQNKATPNHSVITGVDTGFSELNKLTGGWQKASLYYIAARPSMGKTALLNSLVKNSKVNVLMFSIEMSNIQIATRFISAEHQIDSFRLKTGDLSDEEMNRIMVKGNLLDNVTFDDNSGITISEIKRKSITLNSEKKIDMIAIDYIQIIKTAKGDFKGNREQEVSHISRELKSLAKTLDIPIIALAQLSRSVEATADKRPNMSHLRESGSLEQDADGIIFLSRPEYYFDDPKDKDGNSMIGKAIIEVAKNRDGAVGDLILNFEGKYTLFKEPNQLDNYKPINHQSIKSLINRDDFDNNFK
ncbi:MAG: replicative DNA helicase [Bacteroidia bacterium]